MATKSKKKDNCVTEVLGQVMRVKIESAKSDCADFVKTTTTNPKTGEVSLYYSIMSRFVFFWGQGDTIGEALRDFMGQCEESGCKSFIEPIIFNAYLEQMLEQEKQKQKQV
jgi:hypothetical protein